MFEFAEIAILCEKLYEHLFSYSKEMKKELVSITKSTVSNCLCKQIVIYFSAALLVSLNN